MTTAGSAAAFDLRLRQPGQGYRYSLDALLLADFARLREGNENVADLGTGCGIIPLLLARRYPQSTITGIENNRQMAALAVENVRENGLQDRLRIVEGDVLSVRTVFPVSLFDAVLSNPPFRTPRSGRTSPLPGRDSARHETTATLADFLRAAKYLVKPAGRICFIHHPDRLTEFIRIAGELKLGLLRLRMVHGKEGGSAKMFLAELAKGRKDAVTVEPPLFVYDLRGEYTEEAAGILMPQPPGNSAGRAGATF